MAAYAFKARAHISRSLGTGIKSQLQQFYNEHRAEFKDMTEAEIKETLRKAIKEKDYSLLNIQNNTKDGKDRLAISQRFSQEELRGCSGTLEEAEALLQRGSHSSTPEKSGDVTGVKREGKEAVIAKRQEAALEEWAKGKGIWEDNTSKQLQGKYGEIYADGGEANVYLSQDGTKVVKEIRLDYYIEPQLLLDRIVLHNYLFPSTALTVTGFGKNSDGKFVIVAEQPFVQGEYISQEEIKKYMASMGFKPYNKRGTEFFNREKGIIVNDLHDENILAIPEGYAVIDADIRLNTANYKLDGNRTTEGMTNPLLSFMDSMNKEQLVEELSHIEQEFHDYDLAYTNHTDNQKKRASTFTFDDGITVRTPFKPNDQQAEALNVMNRFLKSDDRVMTLSGYAGTGKTSLMEILALRATAEGRPVQFCATTNKAAGVLNSKVDKLGFKATTMHKMFGVKMRNTINNGVYDARALEGIEGKAKYHPGDTIIIDEASMINEQMYDLINNHAAAAHLKIIYVGDKAQLPPVNKTEVSKVFRNADGKIVELTKVERTDDNAILKEATRIRSGEEMTYESSFNDEGKGVAYINPKGEHRQDAYDTILTFIPGLKKDNNFFRILTYTNASVEAYNRWVRNKLGYGTEVHEGEPIMGYTNWGYLPDGSYKFTNGDSYSVVEVGKPEVVDVKKKLNINLPVQLLMTVTPIVVEDSMGMRQEIPFVDVKGNKANMDVARVLAQIKAQLAIEASRLRGYARTEKNRQKDAIEEFLFVNENIINNNTGRTLQAKVFDFGYAMTVHKSQGSTYKHVFVDGDNIAEYAVEKKKNDPIEVDLEGLDLDASTPDMTEADEGLTAYDPSDTTIPEGAIEFDPFDPSSIPAAKPAKAKDAKLSLIQQLNYVAVSRATDTVTVLTKDAKKEDSVLNHLGKNVEEAPSVKVETSAPKAEKPTTTPATTTTANNTVQSAPSTINQTYNRSDNTITTQLVDHLNSIGLNVKNKADLEKYKAEHPGEFMIEVRTPNGEVYGYRDKEGNSYLDETKISPEHPIHDYTRLWDRVVQQNNPALWNRGVALLKQYKMWRQMAGDVNYGKRWQDLGYKGEQLDYLIASELHARFAGKGGERELNKLTKEKGQSGIIQKIKQWILDMWKDLKATFTDWTPDELDSLTLTDFNRMPVRDFIEGINPRNLNNNKNQTDNGTRTDGVENDSRRVVQPTVQGNNQIQWRQTGSGESSKSSQEKQGSRGNTDTSGSSRHADDVAKQVSEVSDAIDKKLADKGIKATKQKVRKAESQEFHDAIAEAKKQNPNGWMVDVHEVADYDNCLTMLTEDGKAGIAVTKDGDIISVFSSVSRDHRLSKLMQMAIAAGGKKLDCYYLKGEKIGLPQLYAAFGFKVESVTPFNAQYAPAEYAEWQTNNPDKEVQGVAAMSLKVEDSIEGYSLDNNPDIEAAPSFDSYDEMLLWRDEHKINMPNYQYGFEDTSTPVDMAWKIHYLKDYDKELADLYAELTEEQKEVLKDDNNIAGINDKIKQIKETIAGVLDKAIEEEDVKRIEKKVRNKASYVNLNKQFDNLLDGKFSTGDKIKFSASEVRKVSEYIGNYISDMITKLQTDRNAVKELFPLMSFEDDVDFTKLTRKEIVSKIGLQNLIDKTKFDWSPKNDVIAFDDLDVFSKANLLVENWNAVMLMAASTFHDNEGFSIQMTFGDSKDTFRQGENDQENQIAYDDFNGYQDEDFLNETEGDAQEHWQIESRTIDVLNSMSELVRRALHECYVLDENGNKVIDEMWMQPQRVNAREATNRILQWTQGAQSLQDMITKLQEKQGDNPWLSQLIKRLSDKSGKESDLQSQFYGVFQKSYQLYSVVQLQNGTYKAIYVNSNPALQEAVNSITARMRLGEHPLFTINGKIKRDMLGNENTKGEEHDFNLTQAYAKLIEISGNIIAKNLNGTEVIDPEVAKESAKWLAGVFRVLGYGVTEDMVVDILKTQQDLKEKIIKVGYIIRDLNDEIKYQEKKGGVVDYNPFAYRGRHNIIGTIKNLLKPITSNLEALGANSFYDSGKMYQSYVTPSFMTLLMQKFHLPHEEFWKFINEEYGKSEWFKDSEGNWRNPMLNKIFGDEQYRSKAFDFKVELNFNKKNYMRNMNDQEYTLSVITHYFAEAMSGDYAWFKMPMQSNKPSSEFFKVEAYKRSSYKDDCANDLYCTFLQELSRIQTVMMRNLPKTDEQHLKNFDTNGRKFCFLPIFNSYLKEGKKAERTLLRNEDNTVSASNETLASLIQKKLDGKKLTAEEDASLKNLATQAMKNFMQERVDHILEKWEKSGIVEASRNIANIVERDGLLNKDLKKDDPDRNKYVKEALENFLWNDYVASKNILQLTVGDIAFYKDAEDLVKRLAQLHAPGIRGNIYATDYKGNRVSDGKYRTLVLKDWDTFISEVITNISEVFDRKIADAPEGQKEGLRVLKDSLVGKEGAYRKINVADAQGFSSPSSYRKKAFMFGKWSTEAEKIYENLRTPDKATLSDIKKAFQPFKPFVYGHTIKSMGVENTPIKRMYAPFQAKNSEYLLIMADALIRGDKSGANRPNLLKAIFDVMEESERRNPTKGIDTVQFESAIKSGQQATFDLNQFADMEGGEAAAYKLMIENIYKKDADGNETNEYDTDTYVQELSYDSYCMQQDVPEHFKNHSQAQGSQERMIIPSDLDFYIDNNGDKNDPNNINYYEWTDPNGIKRKLNAKEFREEYEKTIAANIEADILTLQQEFNLTVGATKLERNIALSKILQREILSSPRYGVDLLQACSVDMATGEFRIPMGDPIQSKRIEQLLNSIIKNRINKQKIAGGPVVQVSNFGTSERLHIRFYDKQGNILKTRQEYEQQQGQSELQEVLSGSDRTIDEAKRILKRGDGKSVQENQLEVYARSKGLWREGEVTEQLEEQYGKKIGHGGESFVYRKDGHTVIKAKDNIYDDVYSALESMQIHNTLFPSTKMTLVGIGRSDGELTFIIEQPYVGGREATKKEIQDFVSNKLDGTLDESVIGGHSYENDIYKLQDLKPANVIVEPNGNLQVIDGDFYLREGESQYASYEEYCKAEQAGLAYYEVFAPAWSEQIISNFTDKDGNIDMVALEMTNPELLKMISYRIPTEDKYSIAPIKIVGFMPREAGEGIMFPYDLTTVDDSDFDIDKRYIMRKDLPIRKKRTNVIKNEMFKQVVASYMQKHGDINYAKKQSFKEQIQAFLDNPERMRHTDALGEFFHSIYRKVAFETIAPEPGTKVYRNNKIIDMTMAVLNNPKTADKLLNPGGFEDVARTGYMIAAYRSEQARKDGLEWEDLQSMSEDELKAISYESKDLSWMDTQIQFYKQNSSTTSMIGIFAVSKIAHATLESDGIYIDIKKAVGAPFKIAGMNFEKRMEVDPRYDTDGNLIGKVAGSLVSASADGVKKPVLELMNINTSTAGILNTLLRLGMPLRKAALFMSQDIIPLYIFARNKKSSANHSFSVSKSIVDIYFRRV